MRKKTIYTKIQEYISTNEGEVRKEFLEETVNANF